jgi:hypothetical protein
VRDGVEWAEAPSSPIEDDDVLEIGPRSDTKAWNRSIARWRRRWPRLAAATVIAVGLVTYTAVRSSSSNRPPSHPVTNSLIPSVNESSHDVALAMVQAQAAQTEPLADIVRPVSTAGACPVVEPGHSPPHAIAAAARRSLPTFTVRDVARTLDQYLGMCAIELRGRDAAGSVFVFDVVAPESDTVRQRTPSSSVASSLASRRDGTTVITSMTVVTTTGWTVVIGCVGAVADQPDSETLLRLGQDLALQW